QLAKNVDDWQIGAVPFLSLMHMEERQGEKNPVIKKAFVNLQGEPFSLFEKEREGWLLLDDYRYLSPIQFYGPQEVTDEITMTLKLERP
ncbi:MAG TPA: diphosphate--fructose-6-phosphate 1-phosphotransferase, partial [Parachlamydiaceae bacterium]|nr:diphosphate--fructose-6-phosphate 1-phosphotransferase [Parachlamydiaceae bacterium]